MDGEVKKTIF